MELIGFRKMEHAPDAAPGHNALLRQMDPRGGREMMSAFPHLVRTMLSDACSDLRLPRGQQSKWIHLLAFGILALYVSFAKAAEFSPSPVSRIASDPVSLLDRWGLEI
jgi:hypothetical protein